jgi:hypothetical protein
MAQPALVKWDSNLRLGILMFLIPFFLSGVLFFLYLEELRNLDLNLSLGIQYSDIKDKKFIARGGFGKVCLLISKPENSYLLIFSNIKGLPS